MAITFSIQNTEVIMTTPQVNVEVQDLVNAIRLFEDDFRMMSFDHIIDAEGKATLPGVGVFTEIVMTLRNPWTIRFEDEASAHVNVTGGTTLAVDAINLPRPVTTNFGITIAQAASGILIQSDTSGLTPTESSALDQLHGQVTREIWLDPSLVSNGNGYQQSPYNNLTDAIDDGETNGVTSLVLLDDITLDRNLKNFTVRGIGNPTIDFAGFDLKGCTFDHIAAQGTYIDSIIMHACTLLTGLFLNGDFEDCALAGDLTCVAGGSVFMKSSASSIAGLGRPTISLNGAGTTKLSIRDHGGGLTIKDCNTATDEVTVEMGQTGSLTFDASNTDGVMVARTTGKFVDETAGATVTAEVFAHDLHKLQGLEVGSPMTVTPTGRTVGDITQVISGDGDTTSTVTRS